LQNEYQGDHDDKCPHEVHHHCVEIGGIGKPASGDIDRSEGREEVVQAEADQHHGRHVDQHKQQPRRPQRPDGQAPSHPKDLTEAHRQEVFIHDY
jgi:hypothetical protein